MLVTELTGQARWTGLVAAAAFVPIGVLSPVGGVIADRMDRRRLLLGTSLPDLVDREDLLGASSLSMAQFNLGRVVGPVLAGVVLVVGSYTWAFALNAVSYAAVMVAGLTRPGMAAAFDDLPSVPAPAADAMVVG